MDTYPKVKGNVGIPIGVTLGEVLHLETNYMLVTLSILFNVLETSLVKRCGINVFQISTKIEIFSLVFP